MAKKPTKPAAKPSPKAKAKPADKVVYPGLIGKDPKDDSKTIKIRLDAYPDDFDPKVHKSLKRNDFTNEAIWYENEAAKFDKKAADMREKAEQARKLGNVKDRATAKKLMAIQKKAAELRESLAEQGVDVDALMAGFAKKTEDAVSDKE